MQLKIFPALIFVTWLGLASTTQLDVEMQQLGGCAIEIHIKSPSNDATYKFLTMKQTVVLDAIETNSHAVSFEGCSLSQVVVIELINGKESMRKVFETKFGNKFSSLELKTKVEYDKDSANLLIDDLEWSESVEFWVGLRSREENRILPVSDRRCIIDDCDAIDITVMAMNSIGLYSSIKVVDLNVSVFCQDEPIISHVFDKKQGLQINTIGPVVVGNGKKEDITFVFEPYDDADTGSKMTDLVVENKIGNVTLADCRIGRVLVSYKRGDVRSRSYEVVKFRTMADQIDVPRLSDLMEGDNTIRIGVTNNPYFDSLTNFYKAETASSSSLGPEQPIKAATISLTDCDAVKLHVYARDRCGRESRANPVDVADYMKRICMPKPRVRQVFLDLGMTLFFDAPLDAANYKFETLIDGETPETHIQQIKTFNDCRITWIKASYEAGNGKLSSSQYFGNVRKFLNARPPNVVMSFRSPFWSVEKLKWRVKPLKYYYSWSRFGQKLRSKPIELTSDEMMAHITTDDCDADHIWTWVENECKVKSKKENFGREFKCIDQTDVVCEEDASRGLVLKRKASDLLINFISSDVTQSKKFEGFEEIVTNCSIDYITVSPSNEKANSFFFDAAEFWSTNKIRTPNYTIVPGRELKILILTQPSFRTIKNTYSYGVKKSILVDNGEIIFKSKIPDLITVEANDGCSKSSIKVDLKPYKSKKPNVDYDDADETEEDSDTNTDALKPDTRTSDNDQTSGGTGNNDPGSSEKPDETDDAKDGDVPTIETSDLADEEYLENLYAGYYDYADEGE